MPLDISENIFPSLRQDIVRGIHCGILPAPSDFKIPHDPKSVLLLTDITQHAFESQCGSLDCAAWDRMLRGSILPNAVYRYCSLPRFSLRF